MNLNRAQRQQPLVSLFNGYIGAMVIFALEEMGFFRLIQEKGYFDLSDASVLGIQQKFFLPLCNTLQALNIVQRNDQGHYQLTMAAETITQQLGFFTWAVGGYGDVLRNLYPLASGQQSFGDEIFRDERYVAKGAGQCTRNFVLPIICEMLDPISINIIADLGCGSGELLIYLCRRYPHIRGVGVDRSAKACELARQNITNARLTNRIEIVEADVCNLSYNLDSRELDLLTRSDTITCLFMLHDLIQEELQAREMLLKMKYFFREATHFLFGDTMQTDSPPSLQQSSFIVGFELVHAFMEHHIWKKQVYDDLFAAADFDIQRCVELAIPSSWLYLLSTNS